MRSIKFKLSVFWFLEATLCCLPYCLIINHIFFYLGIVLAFFTINQLILMLILNTVASTPSYILFLKNDSKHFIQLFRMRKTMI